MKKIKFINNSLPALSANNLNQLQNNVEDNINQLQNNFEDNLNQLQNDFEETLRETTDTSIKKINDESEYRKNKDNDLQLQINGLASGSPLIASSVIEMTDTSRVYVNTTNGNWYYYNGTSWVSGGIYQSTEINDGSIDIIKLISALQDNFTKEFTNVEYEAENVGYATIGSVSGDLLIRDTQTGYSYAKEDLEVNTIYSFCGYNCYECLGIVVVDSSNNNKVVYSSADGDNETVTRGANLLFRTNKSGLVAYISKRNTSANHYNIFEDKTTMLMKLNNILLNTSNFKESANLINTISGLFLKTSSVIGEIPKVAESDKATMKIYKLSRGTKYFVTGNDYSLVSGLTILTENLKTAHLSSTSSKDVTTPFTYEFVANDNGYAILTDYISNSVNSINHIEIVKEVKKTLNKKWVAVGDSLTAASTGVINYTNFISENLGIEMENFGIGGSGYWKRNTEEKAFYQRVSTIPIDADVVTIFGSFNDLGLEGDVHGFNIIGNVSDTGTDTICGCINTTLDNLFARCPNAVVGIITPTPWHNHYGDDVNSNKYVNALKEIAKLRSIPCLDLFSSSNLRPWDNTFKDTYYKDADGVHPNSEGHKRFTSQIEKFISSILY